MNPSLALHDALDRALNGTPAQFEMFLMHKVNGLERQYKMYGNPLLLYDAAKGLAERCGARTDKKSYQLGRLHSLLGRLLIHADPDLTRIVQARAHVEAALHIFDSQDLFNQECLANFLQASWLRAVSIKMSGDFTTAFNALLEVLENRTLKTLADVQGTAPLLRQRTIMEQTKSAHDKLLLSAADYKKNDIEYFQSVRRVFEYSLNSQNPHTMDQFYKLSKSAFTRCKDAIEKVYIYTYLKDVYHYLMLKGQTHEADQLFARISADTEIHGLHGQHRQILEIKRLFELEAISAIKLKSAVHAELP